MVVAVEMDAVREKYGEPEEKHVHGALTVSVFSIPSGKLYIAECGAGEIGAAAATQLLISVYGAELILNFGIVGGLTEEMGKTKLCVVRSVVHYDYDTSGIDPVVPAQYGEYESPFIPADERLVRKAKELCPGLREVICCSGDKFVADPLKKAALHELYGAEICEMESAGILLTANRNRVPSLLIKIVSDGITGGAEEYAEMKLEASKLCFGVMDGILGEL